MSPSHNLDGPAATPPALLGRWHLLQADSALDFAPNVLMEFLQGGRLNYVFSTGDRRQSIPLLYRVEGNELHTEDPKTTHEVVTRFAFGPGDVLIFDFGGAKAWFVRVISP